MRFTILILVLLSVPVHAQRKFGKVWSRGDLIELQEQINRKRFPDSIVSRYTRFVPERSKLFSRFDTMLMVTYPNGEKRKENRLQDIHLKLNDITRYAAPFWAYFSYDVFLPEYPDAKVMANMSVEFYKDTFYAQSTYDLSSIGGMVPYSRVRGEYHKAVRLSEARMRAWKKADAIMTKAFGAKAYAKSFSRWRRDNHSTEQFRPDGAYFPTSDGDSLFVPYEYSFYFAAAPVDLPQTARDFILTFDRDLNLRDTSSIRRQIEDLPDCIIAGKASGAMSEQQAIERAIAHGTPVAKEGYQTNIYQASKHYEWSVFSVQSSIHAKDLIGNPCDTYKGFYTVINAVTGELIRGPEETSTINGCYD